MFGRFGSRLIDARGMFSRFRSRMFRLGRLLAVIQPKLKSFHLARVFKKMLSANASTDLKKCLKQKDFFPIGVLFF